ncbi:hypothetical protein [Streptomyces sp. NBC_01361]|uniref:hypothetical protein n=1 Tax=Streptomyces sp. NBC_01361 TaxID=2903838 RepID=UPI002E30146D|nr:hypothetical protein [Streptomyces sp. NBC_01361]
MTLSLLPDPVTRPFARCAQGHQMDEPLPIDPVPDGVFDHLTWPPAKDPFAFD